MATAHAVNITVFSSRSVQPVHYIVIQRGCKAISGKKYEIARNCLRAILISLVGYGFPKLSSLRNWKQYFDVCLKNCQCSSTST